MSSIWNETATRLRGISVFAAAMLTVILLAPAAGAQSSESKTAEPKSAEQRAAEQRAKEASTQTFHLNYAYQTRELNDIQTDLRNLLTGARIYGVDTQHAISVQGSAEELALAQKVIQELDKPRKMYRLTYAITETDGGKRLGEQHFALIVTDGGRAVLKQGSRVPIVTGTSEAGTTTQNIQVQYQDLGLNIEATLEGGILLSKVVQTSLAEEKPLQAGQNPTIRQTVLDEVSNLSTERPVVLGSLDIPGSTRHEEISVVVELVH